MLQLLTDLEGRRTACDRLGKASVSWQATQKAARKYAGAFGKAPVDARAFRKTKDLPLSDLPAYSWEVIPIPSRIYERGRLHSPCQVGADLPSPRRAPPACRDGSCSMVPFSPVKKPIIAS